MLGEFQLVLSEYQGSGGAEAYKPVVIYQFHAPPTSLSYRPRHASAVTALPGGVHIESGPTIVADASIHITSGLELALSTDEFGAPRMLTGQERADALRYFLSWASERLSWGNYRLEFHAFPRGRHWRIVPKPDTSRFEISNRNASRCGGDEIDLSFIIVGDLAAPITPLQGLHETLTQVSAKVSRVTGWVALKVEACAQLVDVPLSIAAVADRAIREARLVVQGMRDVVGGVKDVTAIPLDLAYDVVGLAADVKSTLLEAGDIFGADYWRGLGEDMTAACAAIKKMLTLTPRHSSEAAALGAGGGVLSEQQYEQISGALSAEDAAATPNPAKMGFPGLVPRMTSYTGWLPYTVQDSDTLPGIAQKELGSQAFWVDIAILNGLGSVFLGDLTEGMVLQIPVMSGGLPFGQPGLNDPALLQKMVDEFIYLRDFRVEPVATSGPNVGIGFVVDPDDPRGVLTVTGMQNYVQRFRHIIFRTELGSNPCFPGAGVYLGIGRKKRPSTRGLTRLSAQAQLYADPRTVAVQVVRDEEGADYTDVAFEVKTRSSKTALGV